MARASTKPNKNLYHITRESLHLTREEASELLEALAPERIEKIENERTLPHPDEVLLMADKYRQPNLCNYYCANQCPIGQQYVPEVKIKDLSQIVLEILASLNSMQKRKERLIEITVDGRISGDEVADFLDIQEELERISIAVEALQLSPRLGRIFFNKQTSNQLDAQLVIAFYDNFSILENVAPFRDCASATLPRF